VDHSLGSFRLITVSLILSRAWVGYGHRPACLAEYRNDFGERLCDAILALKPLNRFRYRQTWWRHWHEQQGALVQAEEDIP
jgi:hypothetical protein